jgi:hypothetical protein
VGAVAFQPKKHPAVPVVVTEPFGVGAPVPPTTDQLEKMYVVPPLITVGGAVSLFELPVAVVNPVMFVKPVVDVVRGSGLNLLLGAVHVPLVNCSMVDVVPATSPGNVTETRVPPGITACTKKPPSRKVPLSVAPDSSPVAMYS